MNLHKLKEKQARINRFEFPLKCEEHNIKLEYDKKIKKLKSEINLIKSKIEEEYKQTVLKKESLNKYIFHIFSLFFNNNNQPSEKQIILQSRKIIEELQNYQEIKNKLILKEKEKMVDNFNNLFEQEKKREQDMVDEEFKKVVFWIDKFNKLKDDFYNKISKKESATDMNDKYGKLLRENQILKWDFNFIKIIYEKMLKMYNKEMNKYKKLLILYNKSNINNIKNKENKLFTTRLISNGNCYDIFNNDNDKKENTKNRNLKLNIQTSTYSTSNTINKDKKCLSQENFHQKKIIKSNLSLNENKRYINKYSSQKKFLTIKTDNNLVNIKKRLKRIFSANSLINKNIPKSKNLDEKKYLKNVINFMKQKNLEKNNKIRKIRLLISDELKMLIWIKNLISKLINEIRTDIDDIKYYLTNDKNNEQLTNELHKNEKLLFFCVYFYDNCIKGSNNTKYFIDNIHNKKIIEKKKNGINKI